MARAVQLNVTVVRPDAGGYAAVFPCGDRPGTSSVNFDAGETVANAVTAPLSPTGAICVFTTAETDLVVDFNGYFPADGVFFPAPPDRLVDSRRFDPFIPAGKIEAGSMTKVQAAGRLGVPADAVAVAINLAAFPCAQDGARPVGVESESPTGQIRGHSRDRATAVIVNLTATEATAGGFAVARPCDNPATTSTVNFFAGQTRANLAIVAVSVDSKGRRGFCVFGTTTHLVVDVMGEMRWPLG